MSVSELQTTWVVRIQSLYYILYYRRSTSNFDFGHSLNDKFVLEPAIAPSALFQSSRWSVNNVDAALMTK